MSKDAGYKFNMNTLKFKQGKDLITKATPLYSVQSPLYSEYFCQPAFPYKLI